MTHNAAILFNVLGYLRRYTAKHVMNNSVPSEFYYEKNLNENNTLCISFKKKSIEFRFFSACNMFDPINTNIVEILKIIVDNGYFVIIYA